MGNPRAPGIVTELPRTIVADPPWWPRLHANTVGRREGKYRAGPQRYYRLLTVDQIVALAPSSAAKSHLYLWVISQHVDWGYLVARASAARSVLEAAIGAGLAIAGTLVLLGLAAPLAVVFAVAFAPVAFGLACAGAFFGMAR